MLVAVGAIALASVAPSRAEAQQAAQGFAVERLYPSAPGGGWFVMDSLDMHGGLGGAVSAVASYARNPLRVTDGTQHLAVVSDEAFLELAFAATYDRFRAYLTLDSPVLVKGNGGSVGGYTFTAPDIDPGPTPDALSNARVGIDARVLGGSTDPIRLGVGAQLWFPGGEPGSNRTGYLTDGNGLRAMGRLLFAGDIGLVTYAGQLGAHLRPLDDSPTPGSPQGSELLFGVAGGVKLPVGTTAVIFGPEVYGASAFRSLLGTSGTAVEALMTGRVEGTADEGAQMRAKLGTGGGIHSIFGAPEWRVVFAIELFDRNASTRVR